MTKLAAIRNFFRRRTAPQQPFIVMAAVKYLDLVYTGYRHGVIMQSIWKVKPGAHLTQEDQGFLTSQGEFVSRSLAAKIAYEAGQVPTLRDTILSENLW